MSKIKPGDKILVEFTVDGLGSGARLSEEIDERCDLFLVRPKSGARNGCEMFGWIDKRDIVDGVVRIQERKSATQKFEVNNK